MFSGEAASRGKEVGCQHRGGCVYVRVLYDNLRTPQGPMAVPSAMMSFLTSCSSRWGQHSRCEVPGRTFLSGILGMGWKPRWGPVTFHCWGLLGLSQSISSREVWLSETKGTRPWNRRLVDPTGIRTAKETETEGKRKTSGPRKDWSHKEWSPLVP